MLFAIRGEKLKIVLEVLDTAAGYLIEAVLVENVERSDPDTRLLADLSIKFIEVVPVDRNYALWQAADELFGAVARVVRPNESASSGWNVAPYGVMSFR